MADHKNMKLGKLPPKFDPNAKKLARYFLTDDIKVPLHIDWGTKVHNWGMMANDELGDCTAAGAGHIEQVWTSNASSLITITDADVIKFYSETTGYIPGEPSTDQGGVEVDVLNYWKTNGFGTSTGVHKLAGWVSVNPADLIQMKAGINWFGALYVGVALPLASQDQDVWDVHVHNLTGPWTPGSWGGHCVALVAYNAIGPICITWGQRKQITWAWWHAYGDEAYALLSTDWLNAQGESPSDLNMTQLQADLAII